MFLSIIGIIRHGRDTVMMKYNNHLNCEDFVDK